MFGSIDFAGAEIGTEQLITTEHVQREKTIALVIPVKETLFLRTVNAIVGGIEIQCEFIGRCIV